MMDRIQLSNAQFRVNLPQSTWSAAPPSTSHPLQPVSVSLALHTDLSPAGLSDALNKTISYSQLYKAAKAVAEPDDDQRTEARTFHGGLRELAADMSQHIWADVPPKSSLEVHVEQPRSLLQADALYVTCTKSSAAPAKEVVGLKGYRIQSVIGVWEHERHEAQPMLLNVAAVLKPEAAWVVAAMLSTIDKHVQQSHPALLETYLEDLAHSMLASLPLAQVTLEVFKPFGNIWSDPPQVRITRQSSSSSSSSSSSLPMSPSLLPAPLKSDKTAIMAIINITPDSFGTAPFDFQRCLDEAQAHVKSGGADILDLGAMSTRPGATDVPARVEVDRLVPFIKAIRATEWGQRVTLSIDTFRASVAQAALEAGADWINDVQAGAHTADGDMFAVARHAGCPIVLMHSRGDPKTMQSLASYDGDVVHVVRDELAQRVQAALEAGVRPEQIIVDPGIGFAKTSESNWALMSRLQEWHQSGSLAKYPLLMGASRKRFLGALTGKEEASERDVATAALMVDAIRQGTRIVRVHNTQVAVDAVKTADQLYRQQQQLKKS